MKTLTHAGAEKLIQSGRPLSAAEQAALDAHLAGCESCQTYAHFHRYLSTQIPAAFPEPRLAPETQRTRVRAVQARTRRAAMQNRTSRTLQVAGGLLLLAVLVAAVSWAIRSLAPQPAGISAATGTPTLTPEQAPTATLPPTQAQEAYPTPPIRTPAPGESCVSNVLGWKYMYTVQPGDTLYRIATSVNTTVTQLMQNNCLPTNYVLKVGEMLSVPDAFVLQSVTPALGACTPNSLGWTGTYTVQAGDTLLLIASTYSLTPDQLFSANCLDANHLLAVGEVLYVPALGEAVQVPRGATPTPAAGQPDITGAYIWLAGFAPDGSDWLAYWLAETIDPTTPNIPGPPSVLHFYQPATGLDCDYPAVVVDGYGPGNWLDDGRFLAETRGQAYAIRPCESETSLSAAEYAALLPPSSDPSLSADGRYRASTTQASNQDGILQLETNVTEAGSGQVLISVPWSRFDALGKLGLGGEWISPNAFLVYQTLERGPMLIELEPTAQVVEVATELFGVEPVVNPDPNNYTGLVAYGAPHPTLPGEFHLLLSGTGMEAAFPNVRLYHSESGVVEELSYPYLGGNGFVPDSARLLLVDADFSSGYEQRSYFSRTVDPADSPETLLAEDPAAFVWLQQENGSAGDRVALGWNDGRVQVRAFPGGPVLLEANTAPYSAVYLNWSPDGRRLVVSGYQPGGGTAMALRVFEVP